MSTYVHTFLPPHCLHLLMSLCPFMVLSAHEIPQLAIVVDHTDQLLGDRGDRVNATFDLTISQPVWCMDGLLCCTYTLIQYQ